MCLYSQVCTHTCAHETVSSVLRNPFLRLEESWVASFPSGFLSGHRSPLSSGNYGEFFLILAWSQGTQGSPVHRRPVAAHSPPPGTCLRPSGAPNSPECRRCRETQSRASAQAAYRPREPGMRPPRVRAWELWPPSPG